MSNHNKTDDGSSPARWNFIEEVIFKKCSVNLEITKTADREDSPWLCISSYIYKCQTGRCSITRYYRHGIGRANGGGFMTGHGIVLLTTLRYRVLFLCVWLVVFEVDWFSVAHDFHRDHCTTRGGEYLSYPKLWLRDWLDRDPHLIRSLNVWRFATIKLVADCISRGQKAIFKFQFVFIGRLHDFYSWVNRLSKLVSSLSII